jgi:hypothetical protein
MSQDGPSSSTQDGHSSAQEGQHAPANGLPGRPPLASRRKSADWDANAWESAPLLRAAAYLHRITLDKSSSDSVLLQRPQLRGSGLPAPQSDSSIKEE